MKMETMQYKGVTNFVADCKTAAFAIVIAFPISILYIYLSIH